MADVLRERMGAEVAIVTAGRRLRGSCRPSAAPGVSVGRLQLYCQSRACIIDRRAVGCAGSQRPRPGLRRDLRPRVARSPRGLLHLSGATVRQRELLIDGDPVDLDRVYQVAGTDWELEPYGGYADPAWELRPITTCPPSYARRWRNIWQRTGPWKSRGAAWSYDHPMDSTISLTEDRLPPPRRSWSWQPAAIVFVSSACMMILELVAGRIMAPYVGVSLYTWTGVIGVILAGMSLAITWEADWRTAGLPSSY